MIIGISGKIGSGKDTLARMIQAISPKFENKKYAYKLKLVAGIILGVDPSKFEDRDFKNSRLGEEWFRVYDNVRNEIAHPEEHNYMAMRHPELMEARFSDREPYTVREFLQVLGTDAMRQRLHQNVWVNALLSEYSEDKNWLVTDVRFQNEADAIHAKGGLVVRVNRHGHSSSTHPSEMALDDYMGFDWNIENNGSLEELENEVKFFHEKFIKK